MCHLHISGINQNYLLLLTIGQLYDTLRYRAWCWLFKTHDCN